MEEGAIKHADIASELRVLAWKVHHASEVHYRTHMNSSNSFISVCVITKEGVDKELARQWEAVPSVPHP